MKNIVAGTIAFLFRRPSYLPREVCSVQLFKPLALKIEDKLLTFATEGSVAEVSFGRIELPDKSLDGFAL